MNFASNKTEEHKKYNDFNFERDIDNFTLSEMEANLKKFACKSHTFRPFSKKTMNNYKNDNNLNMKTTSTRINSETLTISNKRTINIKSIYDSNKQLYETMEVNKSTKNQNLKEFNLKCRQQSI